MGLDTINPNATWIDLSWDKEGDLPADAVAFDEKLAVSLIANSDDHRKFFHRNGIKMPTDGSPNYKVRWFVAELNGVKLFITRTQDGVTRAVLTTEDMKV